MNKTLVTFIGKKRKGIHIRIQKYYDFKEYTVNFIKKLVENWEEMGKSLIKFNISKFTYDIMCPVWHVRILKVGNPF